MNWKNQGDQGQNGKYEGSKEQLLRLKERTKKKNKVKVSKDENKKKKQRKRRKIYLLNLKLQKWKLPKGEGWMVGKSEGRREKGEREKAKGKEENNL